MLLNKEDSASLDTDWWAAAGTGGDTYLVSASPMDLQSRTGQEQHPIHPHGHHAWVISQWPLASSSSKVCREKLEMDQLGIDLEISKHSSVSIAVSGLRLGRVEWDIDQHIQSGESNVQRCFHTSTKGLACLPLCSRQSRQAPFLSNPQLALRYLLQQCRIWCVQMVYQKSISFNNWGVLPTLPQ